MMKVAVCLLCVLIPLVSGHGRLLQPPARSSAWRSGFPTPINYNDNELFCGGFHNQWALQGGKCGICGDPWQGPREHEAGGHYATGIIVANYKQGETIPVTVHITANHLGWIEFKLCPHNDVSTPAKQACFDNHILLLADGTGSKYEIDRSAEMVHVELILPQEVTCDQCILQWRYHAGNSWGTDETSGNSGLGLGPQEEFYGCADISIKPAKDVETTNYRIASRIPSAGDRHADRLQPKAGPRDENLPEPETNLEPDMNHSPTHD